MSFSEQLLQLPSWALLLLIVTFSVTLGSVGTYFGRKLLAQRIKPQHNEVTGLTFTVVAGFYGLLLAFVIFLVWEEFNDAKKTADTEGSYAFELYQDIVYYPDPGQSAKFNAAYLDYVGLVVNKEYPAMEISKKSPETTAAFINVCNLIGKSDLDVRSKNADQVSYNKNEILLKNLNELTTYRNLRVLAGDSEIEFAVWIPLLFGGLITMLFAILLNTENMKLHIIMNGLLGCFIGMVFYLIILINHSFSGEISIKPTIYKQILEMAGKSKPVHNDEKAN
jgi:hypothetical protein